MGEYKRSPLMNCYYRIAEKVDSGHECTYPESVVLQLTDAMGIIGNGSFQYFFENELNADEVAEALNAIGEPEGAEIVLSAKALFPSGIPHEDFDARLKFMQDRTNEFDYLGKKIMSLGKEIDDKLAAYAIDRELMSG